MLMEHDLSLSIPPTLYIKCVLHRPQESRLASEPLSPPQRPMQALAMGGALPLPRPGWLSSPTLGRANRFLSTAAVSLMTPRRPLSTMEKVKVRSLNVEQRTREDSRC